MIQPVQTVFPIYPGLTPLDFAGPHQFLSRCPGCEVIVASKEARSIQLDGFTLSGLTDLSDIEACDILCVPGGFGCLDAAEDAEFMASIRRLAARAKYVTSVCTGSLILGAAGLLVGRRAACHWAWRDMLTCFDATPVAERVVCDDHLVTGGGVTAGIDFALTLIAVIFGDEVAQRIQLQLEYSPCPPFNAGLPTTAPGEIRDSVQADLDRRLLSLRRQAEKLGALRNNP
ncbi:DJ-1/PfpI family protein [Endozoicomonas sp. G2_2]|uniref:DJ-1/PfpI family protein n=1 Tax=Endozoicomonas sp. G2_2 TaxID=2821092 RepID=UPI001ADAEBBF|nr:DJ-1/PfpI family protein [Endozoicomonas sp. G2_2]MBO9471637.1 DJ-1/PfpI family protein [Endozoicomonas sp. G2_2]